MGHSLDFGNNFTISFWATIPTGRIENWTQSQTFFKGRLDEFKIYKRKLNATEVQDLADDGWTGNPTRSVTVTNPVGGAVFMEGTPIPLAATATDNGSVSTKTRPCPTVT